MSASLPAAAQAEIDALVRRFYALFSPGSDGRVDLAALPTLCLAEARIVKTCGPGFEVYDLASFAAPRERLLNEGTLTGFEEHEVEAQTTVVGQVAQRLSLYRKAGRLRGEPFEGRGIKCFQFVQSPAGWRISALAWDDERDGLVLPPSLQGLQGG
jgi:hypothetical protein